MSIHIGSYVVGEVPEPLEYAFLDHDGDPEDLTGFTATFSLRIGSGDAEQLDAEVTDDAGKVTHVWLDGEMGTTGVLRCEFTVTNGTNTYVSDRLVGYIRPALVAAGS